MAMGGWMDAGHAVATEKSLATEWMAIIFFFGVRISEGVEVETPNRPFCSWKFSHIRQRRGIHRN